MKTEPKTQKIKAPKLTFKTTHAVRRALKCHVIAKGTTLDEFLHSLTEAYLSSKGLLSSGSSCNSVEGA